MASHGYLPTLVFCPEQGLNRAPKECQPLLPNHGLREDFIRSSPLPQQNMTPWKPIFDNKQFIMIYPKPEFIDIQDCCLNSTPFNFKFPISGLIGVEKDGLDLLPSLSGITTDYNPYFPDIFHIQNPELDSQKLLMDFVGDLVRSSKIIVHEDGNVSLTNIKTEMKDILSVLAEFYLSNNSSNWKKSLVPHLNRLDYDETSFCGSALALETVIVAPPKSLEKMKMKASSRKKGGRHKTLVKHQSNYFQACESLLSIIVDKNRNVKFAIPMLKKSGPELPNLLTQFSASIAGTGIALLFSVACKVAGGRVPFCSSKLLNTGLGLGLVWLSWAVNRLRDTIVTISSKNKGGLRDDEMMNKLDTSVKEIYFRAATLMALMVMRFA